MPVSKYYLNLVGEYRVAAELLKRELHATITYGNAKGADIYAIGSNRRAAVVEVKSSNSGKFVTRFFQTYTDELKLHPDFWVLYWLADDGSEQFFVLSHAELAVAQASRNSPNKILTWAESAQLFPQGVDNVLAKDLSEYRSDWDKIVEYCSEPLT
ncbi:MAG TPA: hypothetical protein VF821_21440 [Lentzea sp.]